MHYKLRTRHSFTRRTFYLRRKWPLYR